MEESNTEENSISFSELETNEYKFILDDFEDIEIIVNSEDRESVIQKLAQFIDTINDADSYEIPE